MNLILYSDWKLDCNFELFQSKSVYLAAINVVTFQLLFFFFLSTFNRNWMRGFMLECKKWLLFTSIDTDGFDRSFFRSFHLSCVELTI